jgi:predicted ATPase/class 3 adenylate cyclase
MAELPTGTVTFLFTDLESSTRLWEEYPDAMQDALARHDEILRDTIAAHDGAIVKTTGDGYHAAFGTAHEALDTAVAAQRALASEAWGATGPLEVRMGLHTCEAAVRDGDYYGSAVNRAARLMSVAHGGQIVVSAATAELARETHPDLQDLGEHRLRDLSRAEHVFQLSVPGVDRQFPPLRSLDRFPTNLPLQLTSFVGRDRDLNDIAKAFDTARLVTLTGVGGVGKTRLATQVAAELLPRFADGAWLCELAAADSPDAMAQVVANALGVIPRSGMSLVDGIVEFLRVKDVFLVLDNCEHLLGSVAELAEHTLSRCAAVTILATSREGLGVTGEQVWPVRSLSLPDATSTTLDTSDAVRLFIDRAVAAEPGFTAGPEDLAAIGEVCRRLDGIPLAIELAAARVAAMSPAEIAGHLDERFRLLTGGRRTAVERHQTLRATVDWSYSLLRDQEQTVFDRLGVFAGSFDAAAAQAVVTGAGVEAWDVVNSLSDLVAKSMIVAERTQDGTRYQLLETMRAYARERLDTADEADAWRCRHAQYFATLADGIGAGIIGADESVWLRHLVADVDNLRAAVIWALESPDNDDRALAFRIAGALAYSAVQYGEIGVGVWADWCLERCTREGTIAPGLITAGAGWNAVNRGDWDAATDLARRALDTHDPDDFTTACLSYLTLACVELFTGKYASAQRITAENVRAAHIAGQTLYESAVLTSSAAFAAMAGDFERARRYADDALELAREVGNPTALAGALAALGWARWIDDPERALVAIKESTRLRHGGGVFAPALSIGAVIESRAGDSLAALVDLRDALGYATDAGLRTTVLSVIDRGVIVMAEVGNPESAAVFGGAVTAGSLASLTTVAHSVEGSMRADALEVVRERFGVDAYTTSAERGAAMTYEELVDYALAEIDRMLHELRGDDG